MAGAGNLDDEQGALGVAVAVAAGWHHGEVGLRLPVVAGRERKLRAQVHVGRQRPPDHPLEPLDGAGVQRILWAHPDQRSPQQLQPLVAEAPGRHEVVVLDAPQRADAVAQRRHEVDGHGHGAHGKPARRRRRRDAKRRRLYDAPMTDPYAGQPAQPSPEELRAYLEQLRGADAAGLLAEAYNLLAAGAQVKLGRPDARTLIDAMAALVDATAGALPADLAEQMRAGVGQLQLAQVQAERDTAAAAEPATAGASDQSAAGAPAGAPPPPRPAAAGERRMTDRLWIPGRDPGPPPR